MRCHSIRRSRRICGSGSLTPPPGSAGPSIHWTLDPLDRTPGRSPWIRWRHRCNFPGFTFCDSYESRTRSDTYDAHMYFPFFWTNIRGNSRYLPENIPPMRFLPPKRRALPISSCAEIEASFSRGVSHRCSSLDFWATSWSKLDVDSTQKHLFFLTVASSRTDQNGDLQS